VQNFDAFVVFAKVGELQSISGAARALGLPKANVSRVVVRLEETYAVKLVERTTRNVTLTEVGRVVHAYCLRIREEMEEAQAAVAAHKGDPAGTLRIGCPADVARDLTPHLRDFLLAYPSIDLRVRVGERLLPEPNSLDIVLHSGWLSDSRLTARKLYDIKTLLVASKEYVKKHGFLESIEDLGGHAIIGNFYLDPVAVEPGRLPAYVPPLEVARATERHRLPIWNRFASTDHGQILELVKSGLAIAPIAAGRIKNELEAGDMVRVLPEYEIVNQPAFYALYTERAAMVPKIQVFLEFTAELIRRAGITPSKPVTSM
jgi:LysR family transcriptional regulator, transcriptional activator for aaeXAB operon